jgi:hypothetical protein
MDFPPAFITFKGYAAFTRPALLLSSRFQSRTSTILRMPPSAPSKTPWLSVFKQLLRYYMQENRRQVRTRIHSSNELSPLRKRFLILIDDSSGPPSSGTAPFNSRKVRLPKCRPYGNEKRRSTRIPARKSLEISWQEGGSERIAEAFTFSISRYGCGLHSEMFLLPGASLKLTTDSRSICGRVVHTLKDHSTNLVTTGVAFEEDASDFWQVGFDFLTSTSLP